MEFFAKLHMSLCAAFSIGREDMDINRKISNYFYMLRKVLKVCPAFVIITTLLQLTSKAISIISIYLVQYILNSISAAQPFITVAILIIGMAVVSIVILLTESKLNNLLMPKYTQIIHLKMQMEIYRKAVEVELECYEDNEFYDKYTLAMQQADSRAIEVVNNFASVFATIFSIFALSALIASLQPVLIVIALISALVSVALSTVSMKAQLEFVEKSTPINRRIGYVNRVFYLNDYSKEMRVYNATGLFEEKFVSSTKDLTELILNRGKKIHWVQALSGAASTGTQAGIMLFISYQVITGVLRVGDFMALLNGSQQLKGNITGIFDFFRQAYEQTLYIEKYRSFLEHETTRNDGTQNIAGGSVSIDIDRVSYKYINADSYALIDLTLSINASDIVAIAGPNGAGKSSLVKLISRLYTPMEGTIYINKIPTEKFELFDFRSSIGYVFQECRIFATTIIENILMRAVDNQSKDENLVYDALKFVGLYDRVMSMPQTIYTPLTKEFDETGVNLSGGEFQKIALARAFVRKSKLIIFDEPSSALDACAESDIFNAVFSLPHKPTVIIISHRLTNLRNVDMIHFIDSGRLCESGTFNELIELDGQFAKMYKLQTGSAERMSDIA